MGEMKARVRGFLPGTVRPRRILGGPLRGMRLVTSWHDYPAGLTGWTERPLLDWFSAHVRADETWIDIGAHYGYTAFALARLVGERGRVFAFEPVIASAGAIDQGRVLNALHQLTVLPFGLGAAPVLEIRRLPVTRGMADSTITGTERSSLIPVARFDWLWPLLSGTASVIHGIKIDVQGMEIDVLEGMRESLGRWHPRLVVELHAGVSRARVLALLAELGYSPAAVPIDPVRGEQMPLFLDDRSYAFSPI